MAYPSASERQLQSSTNHLIISRSTPLPINSVVDSILTVVYDHGKLAADSNNGSGRNVIFSSLNPNICTTLNWKQPNYGVFFKTRVGFDDQKRMNDDRCNSIKAAIKFAKANNLLGLICEASPLVQYNIVNEI